MIKLNLFTASLLACAALALPYAACQVASEPLEPEHLVVPVPIGIEKPVMSPFQNLLRGAHPHTIPGQPDDVPVPLLPPQPKLPLIADHVVISSAGDFCYDEPLAKSLPATPIDREQAQVNSDQLRSIASGSRVYSPVGPRPFTRFTSLGPVPQCRTTEDGRA
jgi:hypothetical protein